MPDKKQVIMYHHTHWDREWWTTFQTFRYRLVNIVDRLLDVLDADQAFTNFVLDGQTIVLKDYLEVRPEERERLLGHIRSGRVHVGPWHILPDEFLVSGEASIRNLWLGERTARQYGIHNVTVGYLPDQFGHISQMPQILTGFGIDSAVLWRGFGAPPVGEPEGTGDIGNPDYYAFPHARNAAQFPERMQSEFWWEAPDGTRVMGVYLPLEYYRGHFKEFPDDPQMTYDQTVGRALRTIGYLSKYATTRYILEPMGGDHLPIDPRLPRILADLNRQLEPHGIEYVHGSLQQFIDAVKAEKPDLQVVWKGEGRAFGRKAHILPAVLSARLYIKQANRDCQSALERYAEPLQALNWLLGGRYEQNYLWLAWERLIQNHPHDSICGCSSDQVHREMMTRFDETKQMADLLATSALDDIAARVDLTGLPAGAQPVLVFNPLNWARTDQTTVVMNVHLKVTPDTWALKDGAGNEVPFTARTASRPLTRFERWNWLGAAAQTGHLQQHAAECTEVQFVAGDVPALGYKSFYLERRPARLGLNRIRNYTVDGVVALDKGSLETSGLRFGPGLLENQHLRVTVSPADGSLTVLDKETGLSYPGLNAFRDGGDAGDTYNYAWPMGDQMLSTSNVAPRLTWVEYSAARATLRITWAWALPEGLTEDRESRSATYVPFELHSDVTMYPGVKRVDIRTHFTNTAKDHRLQAVFPFGAKLERSYAEGQFDVVERPTALPEGERGSGEPMVQEIPQQAFVSVSAGVRGLTIANRGLPEATVYDDAAGTVAVTVLRAVGWLSREDFLTRVGGAGPDMITPDAQMLGPVVAEYSIIPHAGTWEQAQAWRQAHAFNAPLASVGVVEQEYPLRAHLPSVEQTLPVEGSLVAVEGDLLLTAVKRAEDRNALILRLVNESNREGSAKLRPIRRANRAYAVNLKEEPIAQGEFTLEADGSVLVTARPWEIVTLAFEF